MSSRKAKGKRLRTSQPAPITDDCFFNDATHEKFDNFEKGVVARVVNTNSHLDENGLSLWTLIQENRLGNFLSISGEFYPQVVKLFYANLRHATNRHGVTTPSLLETKIRNKVLTFSTNEIAKYFGTPLKGKDIGDKKDIDANFNWQLAVDFICENEGNGTSKLSCTKLKMEYRLLHRVIAYCLLGKVSGTDDVSRLEIYLIWAMASKIPINWSYFVFKRLENGLKRKELVFIFWNCHI